MDIRTDKLLIDLMKGDEAALTKLMNCFSKELYVFSLGIVRKKEVAEEIVSDIFMNLWNERQRLEHIQALRGYLHTAVRNNSLNYLRSKKNQPHLTLDEIESFHLEPLKCPETILIGQEQLDQINQAIANLPPKNKIAFTLAKVNGLKYKEIAEIMDVSPRTIENHIASALERIDNTIAEEKNREHRNLARVISALILAFLHFF
ncbi:RNA polymerase sigma factor [Sunxiuqinia sp. sy24]|uniref:RNA polymerase sigma factor n=1 Tax=Sunxiuqinia sp. sy24 TaxID=3461495 RepID=UPI004045E2A5